MPHASQMGKNKGSRLPGALQNMLEFCIDSCIPSDGFYVVESVVKCIQFAISPSEGLFRLTSEFHIDSSLSDGFYVVE